MGLIENLGRIADTYVREKESLQSAICCSPVSWQLPFCQSSIGKLQSAIANQQNTSKLMPASW